jgi:hypothetical protein
MKHEPAAGRQPAGPDRALVASASASPGDQGSLPTGEHDTVVEDYVAWLIAAAPPLTTVQRDTLSLLLRTRHRRR